MVAISLGLDFTDATADEIVEGIRRALREKAGQLGSSGHDLDELVATVIDAVRHLDSQRRNNTAENGEGDETDLIWVTVPRSEPDMDLTGPASVESLEYREPSAYLIEDFESDE